MTRILMLAAAVAASIAVVCGQTPAAERKSYLHGPPDKELIYVTLPGTLEGSGEPDGRGLWCWMRGIITTL